MMTGFQGRWGTARPRRTLGEVHFSAFPFSLGPTHASEIRTRVGGLGNSDEEEQQPTRCAPGMAKSQAKPGGLSLVAAAEVRRGAPLPPAPAAAAPGRGR